MFCLIEMFALSVDTHRHINSQLFGTLNPPFSSFWLGAWASTLSLAWLLPNHYPPWPSFHSDGWMATILLLASLVIAFRSKSVLQWDSSSLLSAVLIFIPFLQFSAGLIFFSGQAWTSTVYLLGLLAAILTGRRWEHSCPEQLANGLLLGIGIASVLSVHLQLQTWLGLIDTGIFDLWTMGLSGGRPYANMGQPNQLATLLLWALLACAWGYSQERIRAAVAGLLASFLLIGIALTQSRTAWLGLIFLVVGAWIWRKLWRSKWVPWFSTGLFIIFWFYPLLLKEINILLLIDTSQSYFREPMQGELRPLAWRIFLNGVHCQPWLGYGLTEVRSVQLDSAVDFPPLFGTFAQSHNLFLDLFLWLGLPLGFFVSGAIIWRFVFFVRGVSNAKDAILVMFLGVVGIHAMLELPLHYAYFLLPTGLIIGVLNHRMGGKPLFTTPRWTLMGFLLLVSALLSIIVVDYFRVEASYQTARFELARIGTLPPGRPPEVVMLNQLREQITFMRYEPKEGMTPQELDWTQKIVSVYPSSGSIYKVAKALALNGQPVQAKLWLKRVCKVSSVEECNVIQRVWKLDSQSNPLIDAVKWPN